MPATIIMGGQWGDEGKGKLDRRPRRQSPPRRAGKRRQQRRTYGHHVPGRFQIASGPVRRAQSRLPLRHRRRRRGRSDVAFARARRLRARGISVDNLRISDRAHVVSPLITRSIDRLEETAPRRGRDRDDLARQWTGLRGQGRPARNSDRRSDRRRNAAAEADPRSPDQERGPDESPRPSRPSTQPRSTANSSTPAPTSRARRGGRDAGAECVADGKEVLVECAQGAMLDVDYGTYPYVTSSSPRPPARAREPASLRLRSNG